jgi:hypothetical protein
MAVNHAVKPVKIIEHSINPSNSELITYQLRYWRAIHGEVMTHRVFSRNASSSRAIPVNKIFWQVMKDPAGPILFGKNKKGMQSTEYYGEFMQGLLRFVWNNTGRMVALISKGLEWVGVHKQFANRLTEPWQFISVLVTATEYENWYKLRNHKDAQPEIQCLAREMLKALGESIPTLLNQGGWHLPYIYPYERTLYNIGDLVKMSTARCARVSYGNFDGKGTTIDADLKLYYQLVESKPEHASPTEHQAVVKDATIRNWQSNFDNTWVQHRKFIENNVAVE